MLGSLVVVRIMSLMKIKLIADSSNTPLGCTVHNLVHATGSNTKTDP